MAVKKNNIISIALLLTLAASSVWAGAADDANNLVQLDLKKSSNNSVDVTLFTSNTYNDNVLVRKKSDNKYVILIPKVQSSGFSMSSLNGVKELVSDVNVKNVNDTNGGYTKVTLITTKPLDIKTRTQKSSPLTAEQKEYQTLIAQANAVKNTLTSQQTKPKMQSKPKTEITVNKAPQPVKNVVKESQKPQAQVKINKSADDKVKQTVTKAPEIKLTEVNPQKIEKRQQHKKTILTELVQEAKQEKAVQEAPKTDLISDLVPPANPVEEIKDIQELPVVHKENILTSLTGNLKDAFAGLKNSNILKNTGIILAVLAGLGIISNILKVFALERKKLKDAFIDHLAKTPPVINTVKYNNIVNNNELSWQQKYQSYLSESAKPVSRGANKGHYTFIKTPAEPVEITQKRQELEKMLDTPQADTVNNIVPAEVQNEDSVIHKTIKLKAFDNHKLSLDTADRSKIKSRFKKYEKEIPLQEQKNIDLGDSIIHSNPRRLKDANLDIRDVDKKRLRFQPSDYIMSSVDEYFSILDKETPVVQNHEADAIPRLKETKSKVSQTNPITRQKNEQKNSYLNGLIIKSGFNIDENKGFYMVNLDGKSALVGKVKDEIFVLKKFDTNITNPVQVRHDNANVYMVKAAGFKSLVEVNDDKMGVLIEL